MKLLRRFPLAPMLIYGLGLLYLGPSAAVADSKVKRAPQPKTQSLSWEIMGELDYRTGKATPKLKAFDGQEVRIPGFIIPLDFSEAREVTEFLLAPSYPGCIHVPPANSGPNCPC
jgi:hypothetical protein